MYRNRKHLWGLLFVVLALAVILAGCSGGSSGGSAWLGSSGSAGGGGGGGSSEPATDSGDEIVSVSIMNPYFSETAPTAESEVVRETERISKAKLDITWVPQNTYEEMLNVTLASGEMPQVLMLMDPFHTAIINGIRSGMFWELDPYLDEFPNLNNFSEQVIQNTLIDGKRYIIPRPRPLVREGLIVRKDWLENVGMDLPTTIDEFYEMLVAFKEQDPDRNGAHDTYGYMLYEGLLDRDIFAWHGAPNRWKVENGEFIRDVETPEYMEGLKFYRKLYEEGLMNPDFPIVVRNEIRRDLYNNKVGASIEALDAVPPFYYFQMGETGNYFDLVVGGPIAGRVFSEPGHFGGAIIPKTSVKTEDELRQVLRYFDNQLSDEATEEFTKLVTENEQREPGEKFNIDDLKNLIVNDAAMYPPGDSELNQMLRQRMEEHAQVSVPNPAEGLISATETEKGEQLKTILEDASIQFILGDIDESGFYDAVERWKNAGGIQVKEELAELYRQRN